MKKTSKIHLWIETEAKQQIQRKANEQGISINEYCRRILRENSKLSKIEYTLDKMMSILENRGIYKAKRLTNFN